MRRPGAWPKLVFFAFPLVACAAPPPPAAPAVAVAPPDAAMVSADAGPNAANDAGAPEESVTRYRVPLGSSPMRGGAAPLVTIVELADYECPYCARAEDTVRALLARYGNALRVVFKDAPLPFHPQAEPAAEAALEVRAEKGDDAFWRMHDALFAQRGRLTNETVVRLAQDAGASPEKVRAAIATHAHRASIEADQDLAEDFGAEGTPYFFIDGRPLVGAQPIEQFTAIIDDEMTRATSRLATVTSAAALYDALTRDGQAPPEPERRDVAALPSGDPARGAAAPKVTVHEFADFQCPFCVRVEPTVRELETAYADRVRFVWHDLPLPFHPLAMPAARAGREARRQGGDAAFWQLHDRLLGGEGIARPALDADARALKLDPAKWAAGIDGTEHDAAIAADRTAAEALGIEGTPSFVIVPAGATSGYLLVGAQSYAKFRKLVERALVEAR